MFLFLGQHLDNHAVTPPWDALTQGPSVTDPLEQTKETTRLSSSFISVMQIHFNTLTTHNLHNFKLSSTFLCTTSISYSKLPEGTKKKVPYSNCNGPQLKGRNTVFCRVLMSHQFALSNSYHKFLLLLFHAKCFSKLYFLTNLPGECC